MAFARGQKDKNKLPPLALMKPEDENRLLINPQRGTQLGDFVIACRTDYTQTFSDPWILRFDYHWSEYLLLTKRLLQKPDDLTALVFLPQDMSEVYYVVVPPEAPTWRNLSPKGREDYELSEGYEREVDAELYKDYASLPKRSVYHSVDPQGASWDKVVDDVLNNRINSVAVDYNGTRFDYKFPTAEKEAEAAAFQAFARRLGEYPMEESLRHDRRFDIVPSLPGGVTGRVTVREFVADPKQKAPWQRISFQRTEIPKDNVPPGEPTVQNNLSFGDELDPNESLLTYLATKYPQLDAPNPTVKIAGYF
ncbi:MAG: hypothetical protein J0I20_29620 [Chloroflexi bacterium]|nr:hypothetical protein [Chloroflexota bacterium]OJV95961.1 MAG: hypothetical protein BGO39_03765 [Chloroflexi bacterium 54-19]